MADLVLRWPNPPAKLQPEKGPAFSLHDLQDETHSHVYLVRLLTFDHTVAGKFYYKIGKAKSIPKRIKQFGPCELVASIRLATEQDSLRSRQSCMAGFQPIAGLRLKSFSWMRLN